MSINRKNSEGYNDPTACEALTKILNEQKNKERIEISYNYRQQSVYICSPYAGDIKRNTENAGRYARFAVDKNKIPVIPHLTYPQFLDDSDPKERYVAIHIGLALLVTCQEIWVFGNIITTGMKQEINYAKQYNKCIRYFSEHCKEVSN